MEKDSKTIYKELKPYTDIIFDNEGNLTKFGVRVFLLLGVSLSLAILKMIFNKRNG